MAGTARCTTRRIGPATASAVRPRPGEASRNARMTATNITTTRATNSAVVSGVAIRSEATGGAGGRLGTDLPGAHLQRHGGRGGMGEAELHAVPLGQGGRQRGTVPPGRAGKSGRVEPLALVVAQCDHGTTTRQHQVELRPGGDPRLAH